METRIGVESHFLYGVGSMDLRAIGKRSMEWDPNEWKWDGDLFVASPLTSNPCIYRSRQFFPLETRSALAGTSSNSSSTSSDEVNLGFDNGKKEVDKRRRVIVVEHDNLEDEPGSLSLKLGGHGDYHMTERELGNWNGACGKKTKFTGTGLNRVLCQVDDCGSDLSKAKDYHRRHEVCEMHSKASKALVGSVMQRFCQQCSRFHVLQEFDEGKRSCRRRLAGHNKRRRKTQPDTVVNNSSLNDNHASGYVLLSLLKILSNLHSTVNHKDDKDVLSLLLRSLAKSDAASGDKYISSLLQASQTLLNNGPSNTNPEMVSALFSNGHQRPLFSKQQQCNVPSSGLLQKKLHFNDEKDEDIQALPSQMPGPHSHMQYSSSGVAEAKDRSVGRSRLHNFDLNDICIDSDDCREDTDRFPVPGDQGNGSLEYPSWLGQDSQQSSPPQTSRTSDSGLTQSPSSSNNDAQSRTDRIVFKLFGKEPSDFPFVLRAQILDWLAHSPTEIESFIRPGCVVLTIYLHLPESAWIELRGDLCSSLSRLLDVSGEDTFWRTGWVYVRVQSQIAFIYNGQVVITTSLPSKSKNYSSIVSIKPIAVSPSEKAQFTVKGFNIPQQSTRFLCALEGSYLTQEDNNELDFVDAHKVHDGLRFLNVFCSIPAVIGRGFIEVEDNGLSSSFFPFIVAQKDVCSEICMLESEIELTQTDDIRREVGQVDARSRAMDFIHEMGWLLHRSHLKSRLGYLDPNVELFSFKRFQWLIEFSMDRNWCAVVKKLLDIFVAGIVSARDHRSLRDALLEVGLLHRAVRRNSRPLVEILLKYVPGEVADGFILDQKCMVGANEGFLFRPDAAGPAGLTPLHVVAGRDGSDDILDALTDDPGKVGVEAWRNVRDSTGSTPEDYARLQGHYCYIHLVQKKINLRPATNHVVLDIPSPPLERESNANQNQKEGAITFQIGLARQSCQFCDRVVASRYGSRSLLYKPAMLSMVAIAAVCVCVALLFKSSPEVVYIFGPFRWERLDLGTI